MLGASAQHLFTKLTIKGKRAMLLWPAQLKATGLAQRFSRFVCIPQAHEEPVEKELDAIAAEPRLLWSLADVLCVRSVVTT